MKPCTVLGACVGLALVFVVRAQISVVPERNLMYFRHSRGIRRCPIQNKSLILTTASPWTPNSAICLARTARKFLFSG